MCVEESLVDVTTTATLVLLPEHPNRVFSGPNAFLKTELILVELYWLGEFVNG
jgi:hypothetical protein